MQGWWSFAHSWLEIQAGRTYWELTVINNLFFLDQGGSYLDLKTVHDESNYAYNREFQRMMVLSEGLATDQSTTSEKLLVDLGVNVPKVGNHNIPKKAPHEKYYWFKWQNWF